VRQLQPVHTTVLLNLLLLLGEVSCGFGVALGRGLVNLNSQTYLFKAPWITWT
jgi:hypothetical protein